jgi:hypothetical protein
LAINSLVLEPQKALLRGGFCLIVHDSYFGVQYC